MNLQPLTRFSLLLGALLIGINVWWRLAVRRRELPCPTWLIWFLENPYTEAFASSKAILDRLDVRPGMRVLDVGAGPGRLSIPAAQRVGPQGEVVALDMQAGMLHKLETKAIAAGITNIRTLQQAVGERPLEHNAFDRAWLVLVLGEIPNRAEALQELFRALKFGGILSITEMLPDPHYQTKATVRRLAQEAGFEIGSSYGNGLGFTLHLVKPLDVNS